MTTLNRNHVKLNEEGTHSDLERTNAFLALAEAGGSMQAKFARKELASLGEREKRFFEVTQYDSANTALANAYQTCVKEGRTAKTHHEDVSYGWNIIVHSLSADRSTDKFVPSVYQFFWTAYHYNPSESRFAPSRYVEVKLDGLCLSLEGKPSDVMELAKRANLFEIFPGSWYAGWNRADQAQLAKGRIVRERKRLSK